MPQSGPVVKFSKTKSGHAALMLVRDLLITLKLDQTLSIFEAEVGLEVIARKFYCCYLRGSLLFFFYSYLCPENK